MSGWNKSSPGFLEADPVAHCGDSAEGFYLTTLSTADVATGWCEPVTVKDQYIMSTYHFPIRAQEIDIHQPSG